MRIITSLGLLLLVGAMLAVPAPSQAQIAVGVSVRVGPPVLPVYAQLICQGQATSGLPDTGLTETKDIIGCRERG